MWPVANGGYDEYRTREHSALQGAASPAEEGA